MQAQAKGKETLTFNQCIPRAPNIFPDFFKIIP